jgi:hypothetical protein
MTDMEHNEEQELSTRDIAAPTTQTETQPEEEARFSRDAAADEETGSLLDDGDQQEFMTRWQDIQARFVDDPRNAVEEADALVAGVMQRLADGFAQERDRLEGMWGRGEDVGTEDLRVALQRYRAFFHRLLST